MELTDFYKGNILPIGKYIIQLYLCYIICHVLYDYNSFVLLKDTCQKIGLFK